MLRTGDIDVALEYDIIFEYFMKKRGIEPESFKKVPFRRQDNNVHFSNEFLRTRPLFLDRFNRELSRCVTEIPSQ